MSALIAEIEDMLHAIPPELAEQIRFETKMYLSRLSVLATNHKDPGFHNRLDIQAIRAALFRFLRDDFTLYVRKIMSGLIRFPEDFPDISGQHRFLRQTMKKLGVHVWRKKIRNRRTILERWLKALWHKDMLDADNYITFLKYIKAACLLWPIKLPIAMSTII